VAFFQLKNDDVFGLAGLWESWHSPDGIKLETCTIITTEANQLLKPVHERMPVILPKEACAAWLDPAAKKPDELLPLLRPFEAEAMEGWPVTTFVNSPENEGSQGVERLAS
jgi:putative SOS response-associated peptidase YedK